MAKWYNINLDNRVVEVLDAQPTDRQGFMETSNDSVLPGWFYVNGDVSATKTLTSDEVRTERDLLLANCDWTQLSDSPLTDAKKAEWATYRQQLRDFPANNPTVTVALDDSGTVWPTIPAA